MNIVCVICSDPLTPSDDSFITPCGHIFHFPCLTQWLERSKSCPQCRDKVTQSKIHRIYFNFSNNDTITEDATSLQLTVDSLKFEVTIKEREIKQAHLKNDKYKKETAGLRAEVKKLEKELLMKDTAIQAQKEQMRYFRDVTSDADNAKKEVARLKKKLDEYRSVQLLINAPTEDVDDMIKTTRDPAILGTYVTVMKRELTTSVTRRKELRANLRKLQQDLTSVSLERNFLAEEHEKRKQLEEAMTFLESEKFALENRVRELENGKTAAKTSNSAFPIPDNSEFSTEMFDFNESLSSRNKSDIIDLCEDSPLRRKRSWKPNDAAMSPSDEHVRGNEENSPLGGYKVSEELPKRKSRLATGLATSSILAKKPRLLQSCASTNKHSSTDLTYDGFGGHSKVDKFPSPKKCNIDLTKTRRPIVSRMKRAKHDTGNNRKLGEFINLDQST